MITENFEELKRYLLTLHGWCEEDKMQRLYELVHMHLVEIGEGISVELGIYAGRSLFPMALAHKKLKLGYAFGIETWDNVSPLEGDNSPVNAEWWSNVDMALIQNCFLHSYMYLELQGYCRWIQGRSDWAVNLFPDKSISMLHQDGNHSEEVTVREVEMWSPKMKDNAIWVVDDTGWSTTKKAYEEVLPSLGFHSIEDYPNWRVYKKS